MSWQLTYCGVCDRREKAKCGNEFNLLRKEPRCFKWNSPMNPKKDTIKINRRRHRNIQKAYKAMPKVPVFDKKLYYKDYPKEIKYEGTVVDWWSEAHMDQVEFESNIPSITVIGGFSVHEDWCRYVTQDKVRKDGE